MGLDELFAAAHLADVDLPAEHRDECWRRLGALQSERAAAAPPLGGALERLAQEAGVDPAALCAFFARDALVETERRKTSWLGRYWFDAAVGLFVLAVVGVLAWHAVRLWPVAAAWWAAAPGAAG